MEESQQAMVSAHERLTRKEKLVSELETEVENMKGSGHSFPTPESPPLAEKKIENNAYRNIIDPPVSPLKDACKEKTIDYIVRKPLDESRVLQIVISPVCNKLVTKHTKTSLLRLKNSPVKSNRNRLRECERENNKRKVDASENNMHNTCKRRRISFMNKKNKNKLRQSLSNKKYNLRTRN